MKSELLDRLEDRVGVYVATVHDLRTENEGLRRKVDSLEGELAASARDAANGGNSTNGAEELRAHCASLEKRLERARVRIEGMVQRIKTLEG